MKKITFLSILVTLFTLSTNAYATNWVYNSGASKWVKDITPSMLQFNNLNTSQVQSDIIASPGGANPNPAITSTSGQDLTDGYFAVSGGQVTSATDPTLTNVRNGFNIMDETLGGVVHKILRFASSTSTITSGTKCGLGGYFNINWYIPSQFNYTAYTISFTDSVYNPGTFSLQFLVYGEAGTQLGTTQIFNTTGWYNTTFNQTDSRPFRFKMSIPNTSGLISYYKTPKLYLNSSSEPASRTVTVNKTGNGTVTATYGNLHDQDVETFTLTPGSGETLNAVTYNEATVTPTDNGNGTYTYTTPLLTSNGTLAVTFSGISTGIENNTPTLKFSVAKGILQIEGLSTGEAVSIYSVNGKLMHASFATESSENIALSQGVYFVKTATGVSKIIL